MGYELDIIASAVVGGASLSGGRGSVVGAVLGALIFGVLRNALAQIPGATFYDRMIVGVVVIVIVVMDQILVETGSLRMKKTLTVVLCGRAGGGDRRLRWQRDATPPTRRASCALP